MKVYLSGRMSDGPVLRDVARRLRAEGVTITSSWLRQRAATPDSTSACARIGLRDLSDVKAADVVVALMDRPAHNGGREGEIGAALAWGKKLFVVKNVCQRNVFTALATQHFTEWESVIAALTGERTDARRRTTAAR